MDFITTELKTTTDQLVAMINDRNAINEKITEMTRQQLLAKKKAKEDAKTAKMMEKAKKLAEREQKRVAALAKAEERAAAAAIRLEQLKQKALAKAVGPVGVAAKRAAKKPSKMTVVKVA